MTELNLEYGNIVKKLIMNILKTMDINHFKSTIKLIIQAIVYGIIFLKQSILETNKSLRPTNSQ